MKLLQKQHFLLIISLISLTVILHSCSSDADQLAKVRVSLIDAPADYDAVHIDITDVKINPSTSESGWQSLNNVNTGVFDILELTNGNEAFLGEVELPAGQLSQIRLILGTNNKLTIDNTETDLTIPSGSESGLKLNIHQTIEAGITYKLLIDFDASKSIVKNGNSGNYHLKPVIRASMEAQTGAIGGTISPINTESIIYAIIGTDSISSYPNDQGEFLIRALQAGTYKVVAVPSSASGFETLTKENISVSIGQTNQVGTFDFQN